MKTLIFCVSHKIILILILTETDTASFRTLDPETSLNMPPKRSKKKRSRQDQAGSNCDSKQEAPPQLSQGKKRHAQACCFYKQITTSLVRLQHLNQNRRRRSLAYSHTTHQTECREDERSPPASS